MLKRDLGQNTRLEIYFKQIKEMSEYQFNGLVTRLENEKNDIKQ